MRKKTRITYIVIYRGKIAQIVCRFNLKEALLCVTNIAAFSFRPPLILGIEFIPIIII
jgi:hypothetical protein